MSIILILFIVYSENIHDDIGHIVALQLNDHICHFNYFLANIFRLFYLSCVLSSLIIIRLNLGTKISEFENKFHSL